jgi:hypothetical protein
MAKGSITIRAMARHIGCEIGGEIAGEIAGVIGCGCYPAQ